MNSKHDYIALQPKLERKTAPPNENGCRIWTGRTFKDRYGALQVRRCDKKRVKIGAHRAAFMVFKGDIPSGLCVCHTCDVPACVNPEHLWLGTKQDNADDMMRKGRNRSDDGAGSRRWLAENQHKILRGEDNPSSKLTEEQVRQMRRLHVSGCSISELSRQFSVRWRTAEEIVKRRSWKHVTDTCSKTEEQGKFFFEQG